MNFVLVVLMASMVLKDIGLAGNGLIIRSISQFLALAIALFVAVPVLNAIFKRYALLFAYLVVLCLSSIQSRFVILSTLQVASLFAVMLFFIAYHERVSREGGTSFALTLFVFLGLPVCLASMAFARLNPDVAYIHYAWNNTTRFRGLFQQPAGLAALSGFTAGMLLWSSIRNTVKIPCVIGAVACLMMTFARTFIFAFVLAVIIVLLLKGDISLFKKVGLTVVGGFLIMALVGVYSYFSVVDGSGFHRAGNYAGEEEKLSDLTGRQNTWKRALQRVADAPWLGFGYTRGEDAMANPLRGNERRSDRRNVFEYRPATYSLHSGYLQALLDAGVLGVSLYCAIILQAVAMVVRARKWLDRRVLFGVFFPLISNFGESVLFSPSTSMSLLSWFFLVSALSVGGRAGISGRNQA